MPAVRSQAWKGVIAAYRDRLPVAADTPVVTLDEGGTPLLRAEHFGKSVGSKCKPGEAVCTENGTALSCHAGIGNNVE